MAKRKRQSSIYENTSKSASRLTSAKVFADRESLIKADRFNEVDKQSVKSIAPLVQIQALPAATVQAD